MTNIKEQTVYIPTKNKTDFEILDPRFGSMYSTVKTAYCLSKKELIDLLNNAWDESRKEVKAQNTNGTYTTIFGQSKEQFIGNVISNTKNQNQ